jgi:glucokinase
MIGYKKSCILAFDMGGSFIKSACILPDGTMPGKVHITASNAFSSLEEILNIWKKAVLQLIEEANTLNFEIIGVGVSTPGPFDFKRGCCMMKQKYQAIYGLNLAQEIRRVTGLSNKTPFHFMHDANAFLKGEHLVGKAAGYSCCTGITLGTGLGYACMVDEELLTNGRGTPYIALYRQPLESGILEDVVSERGIRSMYHKRTGLKENNTFTVKQIAEFAASGDKTAIGVFEDMGTILGKNIVYLLNHTYTECLVIGGQISNAFQFFESSLQETLKSVPTLLKICRAAHLEDAALYGVTSYVCQESNKYNCK